MHNSVFYSMALTFFLAINLITAQSRVEYSEFKNQLVKESIVEYPEFLELAKQVSSYRTKRLISLATFFDYAQDPNTIILDTRAVEDYEGRHIKGAINLPFSKFNKQALKKVIGSKKKRILIYCNNNFTGDPLYMASKMAPLALNIPTFINLYGYGYEIVYELKELVDVKDDRVEPKWEGLSVFSITRPGPLPEDMR